MARMPPRGSLAAARGGVAANGTAAGADPRRQLDLSAIGRSGLLAFAGRIYEEWLPELIGQRWWRVVKEMSDQDAVVAAMLFSVEMLIRQVDFTVAPADQTNQAAAIASCFEGMLHDMSLTWEDTLTEILSMLPWGYAYMEIIYKIRGGDVIDPTQRSRYSDGLIGWRKLSIRSQDSLLRWEFDAEGGVQGMWQMAPPTYIPTLIPIEKALLFRTRPRKNNPQGFSVLRGAYRSWYFKKHIENLAGIGIERDLAGLPVALVPPELLSSQANPEQMATLAAITEVVTNIRRDEQEAVIFPKMLDDQGHDMYELKLLTSGGSRQFDIKQYLDYYDQRIAMTMMADFMLLGHEQVGSFALASSKAGLFSAALGAYLDTICATINQHGFTRLMRLNGWPQALTPSLTHGDVQSVDLKELGEYVKALAQSGMDIFPSPKIERYLLSEAHLPVPEDEDADDLPSSTGERIAPIWGPVGAPGAGAGSGLPEAAPATKPTPVSVSPQTQAQAAATAPGASTPSAPAATPAGHAFPTAPGG